MDKKLTALIPAILLFALLGLSACSTNYSAPTPTAMPTATATPIAAATPTPIPPRIDQIKKDIHKIEIAAGGTYYKSWAFLDRMEGPLDTTPLLECTVGVASRTYDKDGRLASQKKGQGFVYGAYIITTNSILFNINIPTSPPPQPPGMSDEDYQKAVDEFLKSLPDPSDFTTDIWVEWVTSEGLLFDRLNVSIVEIKNELVKEKLDKLGILVLKREALTQGRVRPECLDITFGNYGELEKTDVLMHAQHIGFEESVFRGSVMSISQKNNEFDMQGSVINGGFVNSLLESGIGSPVFAFKKTTQKPELVGIITRSGSQYETRASAISINYILELLETGGIDLTAIPQQSEE